LLHQSKAHLGLGGGQPTTAATTSSPPYETTGTPHTGSTETSALLHSVSLSAKRKHDSGGLAKKYAILKKNIMFLYDNEPNEEHKEKATRAGLILLDDCIVELYPSNLWESEIWLKQFPIRVSHPHRAILKKTQEFFVYFYHAQEKESWYYALRRATQTQDYRYTEMDDVYRYIMTRHMNNLNEINVSTMDIWLNAMTARVLWNVHRSSLVRERFVKKIRRLMTRIRRPALLGEIQVRDLNFGNALPVVTRGRFISMEPEGTLLGEAEIEYSGDLKITIATQAKLELVMNKSITCDLVLSVGVQRLSGRFLIRVAPPPSDRCWIGFYEQPLLQLAITPLVGATTIKMPLILQLIEKLLQDEFNDAYVLPNMDDLPFISIPDDTLPAAITNTCGDSTMMDDSSSKNEDRNEHPNDKKETANEIENENPIEKETWTSVLNASDEELSHYQNPEDFLILDTKYALSPGESKEEKNQTATLTNRKMKKDSSFSFKNMLTTFSST
jgi:hypothetical protein